MANIPPVAPARTSHSAWWKVLLTAFTLFIIGIFLLVLTENPNLFPTVVMLGCFMVPAAYVAFFYERRSLSTLTVANTVQSFVYGGVLGVFAASLLEPIIIHSENLDLATVLQVGLIEEFAKIVGVVIIARRMRHDSEIDGLILGAAAGMGFAAFESTGYAFTAFLASGGSLSATVGITLLRGLLSPVGHGTWTAILAGVLFKETLHGHFRLNRTVLAAYVTVAVLHALWDGLPGFLAPFSPSLGDMLVGQALVGLAGLLILWRRWREGVRLQIAALAPPPQAATELETPAVEQAP